MYEKSPILVPSSSKHPKQRIFTATSLSVDYSDKYSTAPVDILWITFTTNYLSKSYKIVDNFTECGYLLDEQY